MSAQTQPAGITEISATVEDGHNALDLQLAKQSFVEILRDGHRVMHAASTQTAFSVSLPPGHYTIRTDGTATAGASRDASAPGATTAAPPAAGAPRAPALGMVMALPRPRLTLSSDAARRHEIDGIACIPADGQSFITVTVQQATVSGGAARTLFLRATGGKLMDDAGQRVIRSLDLRDGTGKFRVVADSEPGVATVWVLDGPPPQRVSLEVEFIGS